jgi:hypothetical protein
VRLRGRVRSIFRKIVTQVTSNKSPGDRIRDEIGSSHCMLDSL